MGGTFRSYTYNGSARSQNYLTRLNSNGTVDTGFVPEGGGTDGAVLALAWDAAASKLYAGGVFATYTNGTGTTQNCLTRINRNGTVDTGFLISGGGFNGVVNALLWDPANSKLYVGGGFTSHYNGALTVQKSISRLNSNGTVDTGFIPANAGFNGSVYALALDAATGQVYAGGTFSSYTNGATTSQFRLARLNSNGTVDTGFVPAGGGLENDVNALLWDPAGSRLYVGGAFTSWTNGASTTQKGLTRLNSSGAADISFVPAGGGTTDVPNGAVNALAWNAASSRLLVGGAFKGLSTGTAVPQGNLASLSAAGVVDTGFVPASTGFNSSVQAVAWDPVSSKLYVGGNFTTYTFNGVTTVQNYLTRLNADGTVDTGFVPAGGGFDSTVYSLVWDPAGSSLYVGGNFTTYTNGGTTSQKRLTRLNSNGTVDTGFVPAGAGLNGIPMALAWDPVGSRLYAGGYFTSYTNGATTTQNYITRLNSNGTVDTGFVPAGGGFDFQVQALLWEPVSSKLYVGGYFTNYTRGSTITQNRITRLNPDGTVDTGFVPAGGGFDNVVNTLAWDPVSSRLFAGGSYASYSNGVVTTLQGNLSCLSAGGAVDTRFVPDGAGTNGIVKSCIWTGGTSSLFCAGNFSSYNSTTTNGVIKLDSDGSLAAQ